VIGRSVGQAPGAVAWLQTKHAIGSGCSGDCAARWFGHQNEQRAVSAGISDITRLEAVALAKVCAKPVKHPWHFVGLEVFVHVNEDPVFTNEIFKEIKAGLI